MNGFDISTSSAIYVGNNAASSVYIGSDQIWPTPSRNYNNEYFTIEALEHGYLSIELNDQYSNTYLQYYVWPHDIDPFSEPSATWILYFAYSGDYQYTKNNNYVEIQANKRVCIRANTAGGLIIKFTTDTQETSYARYNVYGNVQSLFYAENFIGHNTLPQLSKVVSFNNGVVNAAHLKLPATTLTTECYYGMFMNCTTLTVPPFLNATTLAGGCYKMMFYGCTSLTIAPVLPATSLASSCYSGMFYGCTSLTSSPALLATTLAGRCYEAMFQGCTSLTIAPELMATSPAAASYEGMFAGCTNLNYIKCLMIYHDSNFASGWVAGVSVTGTFVKNAQMSNWSTGTSGIPSGWTVIDA